jgi:hypothetical protein
MPHSYRCSAYAPDGKQIFKQISLKKYPLEQAELIGEIWRKHVMGGSNPTSFKMPLPVYAPSPGTGEVIEHVKDDSSSDEEVPKQSKAKPFASFVIDSLEMPTNGGCSFLMIGSTRSGKSTAMLHIWEKFFKKHITMLMTHSTQADIYKPLAKAAIISPDFYRELVTEPMTINRETKNEYEFCLIFDDLAMTGKNDTEMTKLLTIGRNSNMSAIICGQRLQMLNPSGRANCNYVCLFRLNTDLAIKDVVETYLRSYFPVGMTVQEMCRVYKETTADHSFFFVNTLEDTVHICKIKV